jgi:hypothetical protein
LTDKTVLRASFGITDDLWAGITQTVQGIGGIWPSNAQPQVAANQTGGPVTVNWQNPVATSGAVTNLPAPDPFSQLAFYRDPQAKNPYSEQWNLGVDRQFGANTVVTANYVGSESHRLIVGGLYNTALTPGPDLNPDGTTATGDEIPAAFARRQLWQGIAPTFYDRGVGTVPTMHCNFPPGTKGMDSHTCWLTPGPRPLIWVATALRRRGHVHQ